MIARARWWARQGAAGLALVGFSATAQAPLDIRVALVIGNAAYPPPAALANPSNDAAAMAATLRRLGFQVTEVRDGTREQMAQAIARVKAQLQGRRGVGMFYYAGHGLQLDWRNYMLPVDARPATAADVVAQSVHMDSVIDAFKSAGNRVNIVVLDACRDNPFAGTASAKGLAQVDAPPGTFLAYATAPGNTAEDGAGSNGLYTAFLLQELARPTAKIEDVFKRVRLQVRQRSQGRQIPWESTSLEEDFLFDDGRAPVPAPSRDDQFAAEKAAWDRIKASRRAEDFYAFLQQYPNGLVSEAAQERLDQLAQPQVEAAPAQGRERIVRSPRVGDLMEYVYRHIDTRAETRRVQQQVTALRDDRVEFNDGQIVTTLGGASVVNDQGVHFDPPLQVLPAGDFQIGKRWATRVQQSHPANPRIAGWLEQEARVAAYEQITVPAGTFMTYRIESTLRAQNGLAGQLVYWVSPQGIIIRLERRAKLGNGRDNSFMREAARVVRVARS